MEISHSQLAVQAHSGQWRTEDEEVPTPSASAPLSKTPRPKTDGGYGKRNAELRLSTLHPARNES
jgi:hypothetical protein